MKKEGAKKSCLETPSNKMIIVILQTNFWKWYRGRVARRWSAKPYTAVRIRSVPHRKI